MKKIILFANTDWYLYNFRLELAQAFQDQGNEVLLISPDGEFRSRIEAAGFEWKPISVSRRGMNPIRELYNLFLLLQLYSREKPDIVHHFTIKCVLYGSTVAHLLGIKKVINSIEGLGYVFTENSTKVNLIRQVVLLWYRWTLHSTKVIFLNKEDQAYFFEQSLIKEDQAVLIAGSGVNVKRFSPAAMNVSTDSPLVVLVSRMLYDKGVAEFVEAARILKGKNIKGRFALVGNIDTGNPAAIPLKVIEGWQEKGWIEWWGWRDKMWEVYQQADIACLPSYREGLPKMLIEAGACGLPLVTTDIPGCRDVVQDGKNGLLVQPRDVDSLADALEKLLLDETLRKTLGKCSREIVEKQFSAETVIRKTIFVYEEMTQANNG